MNYQNNEKNWRLKSFIIGFAWGILLISVVAFVLTVVYKYNDNCNEREYVKKLIKSNMAVDVDINFNSNEMRMIDITISFVKPIPQKDIFIIKQAFRKIGCNTKYIDILGKNDGKEDFEQTFAIFIDNVVKESKFLGLDYDFVDYTMCYKVKW